MRKGFDLPNVEELKSKVRRLEDRLFISHQALYDLVPEPASTWLAASLQVATVKDADAWHSWLVEHVLAIATRRPGVDMGSIRDEWRAACPLCGGGASSPHAAGFSYPIGLRRHLSGSHGSRRCPVVGAAHFDAWERVRANSDHCSPMVDERAFTKLRPRELPATPPRTADIYEFPYQPIR